MSKRPLLTAIVITIAIVVGFAAILATMEDGETRTGAGFSLFGNKVGVVEVTGAITSSTSIVFALHKLRNDSSIKAVILRVNSPGGGVAASQEIYREVARTAAQKPVICSMGSVAASGGYYVAAPCTKIVASPGTLTGSIGVILSLPNLEGLFQKIGLRMEYITAGKYKGAGAPGRPLTEPQRAMLDKMIKITHDQFINDVARARKIKPEELRKIADGRVFTAQTAKGLGLVDQLGNINDAVNLAGRMAGIKGRPKLVWPSKDEDSLLGRLLRGAVRDFVRETSDALQQPGLQYLYNPAVR